jgi:hypothetical protein
MGATPDSCTQCPHLDQFHGTCTHPLRQVIIRELETETEVCPLFAEIRAEAMQDLEASLGERSGFE